MCLVPFLASKAEAAFQISLKEATMSWFRLSLLTAAMVTLTLAATAQGRYITSLSSTPAAPVLTVLDEDLRPVGSVPVPQGAAQVLLSDDGAKLIVVSENSQSSVTFVTISGGALSQPRTIGLGAGAPVQGILSPDGAHLYVVTRNPSLVYMVRIDSEQVVNAAIPLPGDPIDAELTLDGQYLLVLCAPNLLMPIQTSNWQGLNASVIAGTFSDNRLSLSVAPFGRVFVTALNNLIELRALPPFDEVARTSLSGGTFTHPGKLYFSPGSGNRAFAANRVQGAHSIGIFDFQLRSQNSPAGAFVGGAPVVATVSNPFGNAIQLLDRLIPVRETRAIGYSAAIQQVFDFNFVLGAGITVNDFRVNQIPLTNIESIATSDEYPNALYLFYIDSGGTLSRFPLAGIGATPSRIITPGKIHWASAPSTAIAGNLYGFGGGQANVSPSSTIRYYLRAIDSAGRPVKGRTVNFRALTSGVQILQPANATNRYGWTYVDVVAPEAAGPFTVEATLGNLPPVQFTSTVVGQSGGGGGGGGGGTPDRARLVKLAGDGQLTRYGTINIPLVVQALDADGKPIAGKQVIWQTTTTNLNFTSPTQTITDSDGKAQVNFFFLGSFPLGQSFVQGTVEAVSDIGNVTFFINQFPANDLGFPSVQMLTPEPSNRFIEIKLGQPARDALRFRILSGFGQGGMAGMPIPKVGLTAVTENQDPAAGPVATCQEGTALSGDDGIVSCTLVASGRIGTTFLTATVGGGFDFPGITLTVLPGDPVPPVIVSGNNQSGKTGTTLSLPLVARVVDAGGNPLPGTSVVWSVSNPSALSLIETVSTADSNGRVSTRVRLGNIAGTFQVTVRAGTLSATFTVTVESTATTLQKISGDGQTGVPINTAFPSPLIVRVVDAQNAPVSGVTVSWSIAGPGALSASSTPTGADGRAQVTVTAGASAGTITVTASVAGLTPVSFTLQSIVPGPAITASSFRNYATGAPGSVAPGALVLLTGGGIAKNVTDVAVANIFAGRLPQTFRGLVVEFRSGSASFFAPIYWIAKEGQTESALIQVPYEISGTSVEARVSVDGIVTSVTLPVTALSPGIIEDTIDGRRAAVVIRSDGLVVTRATPARRGEVVRMYAIGLGQATPLAETNRVGRPDQKVNAIVAVGIDNAGVEVIEAKLAENLIGIYEVFFRIPENAQLGDRPLGLVAAPPGGTAFYGQPSVIPIGQAQ
jgi:uncharacterized protein (TIGR03437 family)